ncbi:MAG: hypothetical protein H6819_06670 [Phycisphaerales bacterium]|nr:hypothetical protein [Phycisphaerales bacterium]MCB9855264.1 hypothetical protein [Phycisphaerales bacterium]MCB9862857.1 hypothetical protein [Phycisphaerales bacterium]
MAVYSLFINDTSILGSPGNIGQSADGIGDIVEFSRSYDDLAKLTIRMFDPPWEPRFGADATVLLYRDGVLVFEGLTGMPRSVVGVRNFPVVEYVASDYAELLRRGSVLTVDGDAAVSLAPGALSSVVDQLLTLVTDELTGTRINLPATVQYFGGADAVETFPVSLQGESIDEAMRKIAAAAPGVGVAMLPGSEPGQSQYSFVNLYGSPHYSLEIDATLAGDLSIEQSLEGRAGAVKTLRGQTTGQVDVEYNNIETLTADWTADEQAKWRWQDAFERNKDGERFSNLVHVHRRFKYADAAITEDTPKVADVETIPGASPDEGIWQRVAIESIDTEAKTITLVLPAITMLKQTNASRNNPFHPGKSQPARVKLRYHVSGTGSLPINIAANRVPTDGFGGRAYQLAPRTCGFEKVITVPDGVNKERYADAAFRAFSEPTIVGSIPLNEDLPAALWFLNRRINIAAPSTVTTGYESMQAPMRGVRVTFDDGGAATIDFSRDDADMLGEGAR